MQNTLISLFRTPLRSSPEATSNPGCHSQLRGGFRMKKALASLGILVCCWPGAAWSQAGFQPGDRVDVDIIMAGAPERSIYRPATVVRVEGNKVFVRLSENDVRPIPLNPDRAYWVKAADGKPTDANGTAANQARGTSFTVGQRVDADVIMAGAPERSIYRPGTVTKVEAGKISVRLDDGDERTIPLRPDRSHWVVASIARPAPVNPPPANPAGEPKPEIAATNPADRPAPVKEDEKPAGIGAPPSGTYNAHKISPGGQLIGLGKLEIKGNTYRGIAGGNFSSFTVANDGNITWSNGLTGMPEGWLYVRSVYVGKDHRGRPLIKVFYRSKSGWNDAFDCVLAD